MYIHSDFAEEQQEDRRKKGSIAPWLIGGGLLAAGGLGLALASKGKAEPNAQLVKKGVDEAKIVIKDQIDKNYKSGVASVGKDIERLKRRRRLLTEVATKERNNTFDVLDIINDKNKNNQYSLNPLYGSKRNGGNLSASRVLKNRKLVEQARELAKSRGLEYSMRYTTTANFSLSGINSGVLSKITGDLGQTVQKAKNWLQKARQAKQEVVARTKPWEIKSPYALKRATPALSGQQYEAMVKQKYGDVKSTALKDLTNKPKDFYGSALQTSSNARNDLQAYKLAQLNMKSKSSDVVNKNNILNPTLANNRSLRLRYTRNPVTGALVSAAYKSPISFLCDL